MLVPILAYAMGVQDIIDGKIVKSNRRDGTLCRHFYSTQSNWLLRYSVSGWKRFTG